ncbi:hypothetical protein CDL15_Pgr018142 [Punica granatum]|uniref:Protein kinase domain-containing protein n=1 Tax=Punica granatum TaxID=22663 RepID=A0A218WHF3_PUNGR|nr:hypothetical protein CDL15_Pgr018142 [Punica granatum]
MWSSMEGREGLGLNGRSLFVCGFGAHWPILLIFSLTLQPVFSVDSSATDTAAVETPSPAIKPSRFEPRLAVPLISVSSLLLALLLAMGMLKLLRLRLRRRKSNRVVEEGGETGGADGAGMGCWKDEKGGEMAAAPVVRECNSQDVRRMTGQYGEMIGAGGFSKVYLGRFSSEAAVGSGLAAVKVHNASERLNMAFRQELDILLRVRHDNIVKLIGFCDDEKEGALVFEYLPNGNLQERLHGRGSGGVVEMNLVLSWRNRMVIAYQLAQAIEYLHEKCSPQIIHGDVKASNVLLDGALNCKLCDFGSAKMGFSSLVQLNYF